MTLYETIDLLKKIALKHPNIGSASEGNIYEYMNANPSVKYGVFFITQGTHSQDEMFNHFEFTLFYVDRLVDDMEENRLQIQSIGKEILSNILTFFCEEFDAECDNITYQPFTQKFVDMTAGIYSTITIDVPKDVICPEEYWNEDWKVPVVVIRNQDKRVVFTENGTYTIDYDPNTYTGLGTVEVNVNIDVDSYYNNGYNQGKTDGISEQKSKLESINITENGTYTKEDGYSHIEVNVPDLNGSYDEGYAEGERVGYGQGKTDGISEQKGKLSQITISENGTYTNEDGYSHIEVNVPDLNGSYNEGYEQGKTDGINEQKSKLESISITENGVYSKEDGYNHIEVNVPDLNGSYDEGYAQGKTDGIDEQKSKLESINITENGRYTKEDGYNEIVVDVPDLNGSYNEGYEQGKADVEANARVLNVTKNGTYNSKFSDPIPPTLVTGRYADGTDFYNYAELNGKVFNTKIAATVDSRLEFWYKGDNTSASNGWNAIIGSGNNDNRDCFQVRYWDNNNGRLLIEIGNSGMNYYNWDDTVWHHLIVSKAEGLWIDGKKEWNFRQPSNTINGEFLINGVGYNVNSNANGTFGMIKIDDTIIIPTADGFLNTNTGELLEVVKDGGYTFTENLPTYGEGELYKTINVDVKSKINPQKYGLRLGYSTFTEVPEWVDFEGITDMSYMFNSCRNLQTIPLIDTSNVTNMNNMFEGCDNLQTIPLIDTSNVINMSYIFHNCSKLQTIPSINTSNVVKMDRMFYSCTNLKTLPELDASKLTDISNYFRLTGGNLTDVGGWKNLKINWNDSYGLVRCPNLTYQSCINVLNGLYDFVGNGSTETRTLKVHANFLTTVGDEISIGVAKGWTITA